MGDESVIDPCLLDEERRWFVERRTRLSAHTDRWKNIC